MSCKRYYFSDHMDFQVFLGEASAPYIYFVVLFGGERTRDIVVCYYRRRKPAASLCVRVRGRTNIMFV